MNDAVCGSDVTDNDAGVVDIQLTFEDIDRNVGRIGHGDCLAKECCRIDGICGCACDHVIQQDIGQCFNVGQ